MNQILQEGNIPHAQWESNLILKHLTRLKFLSNDTQISEFIELKAISLSKRRATNYPLQFLIGSWEFRDIEIEFPYPVLIPRPETEELVDIIYKKLPRKNMKIKGFEIGTGSGALSLSMLSEKPNLEIVANDISHNAILTAQHNANRLNLSDRFHLFQGDALDCVCGDWDFIVSNPPYIDTNLMDELQNELSFEPHEALYAGAHGMSLAHKIISQSAKLFCPLLILEIAEYNAEQLLDFAYSCGFKSEILSDLSEQQIFLLCE